jgi:hypothetical protein
MSEETPTPPTETPTPPTNEINQKPLSAVDEANEVLEKMERVRDETKQWVERAEELKAEQMISGSAEAGAQQTVEKSDDETLTDQCNADLEGTGLKI